MTDWLDGVEDTCSLVIFSNALAEDGDFWEWVFHRRLPTDPYPDDGDDQFFDIPELDIQEQCPECGEYGPCGYDAEGRPMVHVVKAGVEDLDEWTTDLLSST